MAINLDLRPDEELNWTLDRLPKIKKELEHHGYAVVEQKTMDTSRGLLSCAFWLAFFSGLPLVLGGIMFHTTGLGVAGGAIGAGAGILIAAVSMALATAYYDKKKGRK